MSEMITVFTARRVITMDPSRPEATAVAVRDGRIVEVGDLESLKPWLDHHPHTIDDRFVDAVLMPGLIDPHLHPGLAALLLACEWVPPEPWDLPDGRVEAVSGKAAFLARVGELHGGLEDPDEPLVTFGYHAQYHGDVLRSDLDAISTTRPIVCWQRSFHEIRCNEAALTWINAEEGAAWDPHIELDTGRLFETGMVWSLMTLAPHLMGDGKFEDGLCGVRDLVHLGGVTTICDAGFGLFDMDSEWESLTATMGDASTPYRTYLMPQVPSAMGKWQDDTLGQLGEFTQRSTERISFIKAAKVLADGAFIAQLMIVGPPGYIDGHSGAWLAEPDQLLKMMRPFWEADYDLHIHCNGDVGAGAAIDAIDTLLHEHPRFDHRSTLHHFGVSTQAQIRRMAALGIEVQANGYYLYQFGDRFRENWLGDERASLMTRVGSARRHGVSVAVHSDLPMAPVRPLLAAQAIATRRTREGTVMGPEEAVSIDDALGSITIEAAYQMRMDHEIGSLAAGKLADLVALGADPYEVGAEALDSIEILATVVGGDVFPLS